MHARLIILFLTGFIGDLLAADVRAHGCGLDETRVRKLLAVDTTLNAQGLEVWLRRRARRWAAPG